MYEGMMKIYKKDMGVFAIAVAHLIDIGCRTARKITDEDIDKLEENGLMTKEFIQNLVRTTREIALECDNDVSEVIRFCAVENIFDTSWYKYEEEELEEGEGMWV